MAQRKKRETGTFVMRRPNKVAKVLMHGGTKPRPETRRPRGLER